MFKKVVMFGIICWAQRGSIVQAEEQALLYDVIRPFSMHSFEWAEDEDWPNEAYGKFLERCMRTQTNPTPQKRRTIALRLLNLAEKAHFNHAGILGDTATWDDLDLFAGKLYPDKCLLEIVDRTTTEIGKAKLSGLIASVTDDIPELLRRQSIVKELVNNEILANKLKETLEKIRASQDIIFSFWGNDHFRNPTLRQHYNIPYFTGLNEMLNQSEIALTFRSLSGHNQRFTYFLTTLAAIALLPLDALGKQCNYVLPQKFAYTTDWLKGSAGRTLAFFSHARNKYIAELATCAVGAYCAVSLKEDFEWFKDNIYLQKCLQIKLICVARFIEALNQLASLEENNLTLKNSITSLPALTHVREAVNHNTPLGELIRLLQTSTFIDEPSFFSNQGRILIAYELMHKVKEHLAQAWAAVGEIDAYLSVARLYKEFEHKEATYTFTQFSTKGPHIVLKDFWNPFIKEKEDHKIVVNSLELGGEQPRNSVITGPNAGGKSTLIKALTFSLILSQSLGIAPAKEALISPFSCIETYLNIIDDIASGNSLFKAQVNRMQAIMKQREITGSGKNVFIALDEPFNGTSSIEGDAIAYSVAEYLGKDENIISILSTHSKLLTTLEEKTQNFANYKQSVLVAETGKIIYPFKITRGVSHQNVALDILRQEGFHDSLLDQASCILRNIKEKELKIEGTL